MKISLVKKLSIGFILAVLTSIILASGISNYTVGNKFKDYLLDEHKAKVENVVKIIDDLYTHQKDGSKINTDEIQRYAELQPLYLVTVYGMGYKFIPNHSEVKR